MIDSVHFKCFKSFWDAKIDFDSRLTVVVGPNGTGKTSILEGIQLYAGAAREEKIEEISSFANVNSKEFSLEIQASVGDLLGTFVFSKEMPVLGWRNLKIARAPSESEQIKREIQKWLKSGIDLALDQAALSKAGKVWPVSISKSGEGLSTVLANYKLENTELFNSILQRLKSIIPSIVDLRCTMVNEGAYQLLFDYENAKGIPAYRVSLGTLLVLGIITVILGPGSPRLVLIDDIDHGLHPQAQMKFVDLLKDMLEQIPDLQIIATTHSSFILHRLEPNQVRVTGRGADGYSICKRLTDHPKYAKWSGEMSPGEFWSHLGDDWVGTLDPKTGTEAAA